MLVHTVVSQRNVGHGSRNGNSRRCVVDSVIGVVDTVVADQAELDVVRLSTFGAGGQAVWIARIEITAGVVTDSVPVVCIGAVFAVERQRRGRGRVKIQNWSAIGGRTVRVDRVAVVTAHDTARIGLVRRGDVMPLIDQVITRGSRLVIRRRVELRFDVYRTRAVRVMAVVTEIN